MERAMKLLVIGDYISDVYMFGTATRLCPEAPVPVIVPTSERDSKGGAGLVKEQLKELGADVVAFYGSFSEKRRFFAGNHLVCRVDEDSIKTYQLPNIETITSSADAFVIADYGKGAMTPELARQIVETGKPCFVDAKHHWGWYLTQNFQQVRVFPNEHEGQDIESAGFYATVRKLGANGCRLYAVWGERVRLEIPATVTEVVDTTGAGDIFMAGFVYAWTLQLPAEHCLEFANTLAGESCRHRGTFVVGREFAQSVLDRLRASRESVPQTLGYSHGSSQAGPQPSQQWNQNAIGVLGGAGEADTPQQDWSVDRVMLEAERQRTHSPVQTPPESPSGPTSQSDTLPPEEKEWILPTVYRHKWPGQNPTATEHLREHTPEPDQAPPLGKLPHII